MARSPFRYMGCQIDTEETIPGDPDGQIVYVNKVQARHVQKAASWLSTWLNDCPRGRSRPTRCSREARLRGYHPDWQRPFLGPLHAWSSAMGFRQRRSQESDSGAAALELLATLVGIRLWVPEGEDRKTSRVAIRGYTDNNNKSNESLLKKATVDTERSQPASG